MERRTRDEQHAKGGPEEPDADPEGPRQENLHRQQYPTGYRKAAMMTTPYQRLQGALGWMEEVADAHQGFMERAEIIRVVSDETHAYTRHLYESGLNQSQIAQRLADDGVPTAWILVNLQHLHQDKEQR